jgi:hypothetical protein
MFVKETDENGNPYNENNPKPTKLMGSNGVQVNVTPDGKLETNTTITVDTLTVTEVTNKGSKYVEHTFQDASTVAGDGVTFSVEGYKILTIQIMGTSTSRSIVFQAKGAASDAIWDSIMGVNLTTFAAAVNTTGNREFWQFDVTGLKEIKIRVNSVAGGYVTIKGRAVA